MARSTGSSPVTSPLDGEETRVEADSEALSTQIGPIDVPMRLSYGDAAQRFDEDPSAFGSVWDSLAPEITITAVDEATLIIEGVTTAAVLIPEVEMVNVLVLGAGKAATSLNGLTSTAATIPELELVTGTGEAGSSLGSVTAAASGIPEIEVVSVVVMGGG